jgi:hypothetical protein
MRDRVIVISPRKSGTHLIQRLLVNLGYGTWGDLGVPATDLPRFSIRERIKLARLVLPDDEYSALDVRGNRAEFIEKTNLAWEKMAASWAERLGQAAVPGLPGVRPGLWRSAFSDTPAHVSWFFHSLDISRIDPGFLTEWRATGQPAFILNLRDPRDALVSMANFLASPRTGEIVKSAEGPIFFPSYSAVPDLQDRIDMILTDPCVPLFQDYDRAVSFFRHPDVCKVSFEELVGPEGGGDRTLQLQAIIRVAEFLEVGVSDMASLAARLYDRHSFTFHRGQSGVWRTAFNDSHKVLFDDKHGSLLSTLGYRSCR